MGGAKMHELPEGILMLRWLILPAAFLAAGSALAEPLSFPSDNGQETFVTPSGNIGCVYTPAGGTDVYVPTDGGPELSCDRVEPKYLRFTLGAAGPATVLDDVGDASCCGSEHTIPYGGVWRADPFTCISMEAGLACARDDGNGFFISRAKTEVH
jgi:hypothetical protein